MPTTTELKLIGQAVVAYHPDILQEILPLIKKPQPILVHLHLLKPLFSEFCKLNEVNESDMVGTHKGLKINDLKRLFIGAVVTLYCPEVLNDLYKGILREHLRSELAGLLQIEASWISAQVSSLKTILNRNKSLPAYKDYKAQVDTLANVLAAKVQ